MQGDTVTEGDLPEPRKRPKQERSKIVFDAIKTACRQILDTEGSENLTAARLEEVSGVSVGSIYQYFPNLDAVVAEVFRGYWEETFDRYMEQSIALCRQEGIVPAFRYVIRDSFNYHRDMLTRHKAFYQRYHRHFMMNIDYMETTKKRVLEFSKQMLSIASETKPIRDIDYKAYMLAYGGTEIVQATLTYSPDKFFDENFERTYCNFIFAFIESDL